VIAAAAASSSTKLWASSSSTAGTLLILGGTGFIGPHLTEEAIRRGWRVTHFNRGRHSEGEVPGVETLLGDRNGQLDALRGRRWDVMIDNTGFVPKYVRQSADLLAPQVGFCVFVSSIAVYASFATPNTELSPTGVLANPDEERVREVDTYGPMKALCERYSGDAFGDRL
jgi:2'-hydroxyisoflavone reductase